MIKKRIIKKKEIEIEFETVGEIERKDLGKIKAGEDGPGTNGANTCTTTDRETRNERTCIPTI